MSSDPSFYLSPLPGHPIPTLFTDPPVAIRPSPKVRCPFGSYVHLRLGSRPRSICTHLNRTKYTKTEPLQGQAGQMRVKNSYAVTHENRLVRYSPHAPGFS